MRGRVRDSAVHQDRFRRRRRRRRRGRRPTPTDSNVCNAGMMGRAVAWKMADGGWRTAGVAALVFYYGRTRPSKETKHGHAVACGVCVTMRVASASAASASAAGDTRQDGNSRSLRAPPCPARRHGQVGTPSSYSQSDVASGSGEPLQSGARRAKRRPAESNRTAPSSPLPIPSDMTSPGRQAGSAALLLQHQPQARRFTPPPPAPSLLCAGRHATAPPMNDSSSAKLACDF